MVVRRWALKMEAVLLQNVVVYLQVHMALQLRRPASTNLK
jgi:hypothetical protein